MTSAPAPSADAEFLMTLRAGVDAADLAEAKDLVRAALGVTEPFVFREDGGVYYAYEPNPAPQDGIGGAHVYGQIAKPKREGKFPALVIFQWASPPYPLQKSWVTDRAAEGWPPEKRPASRSSRTNPAVDE